MASGLGGVVVKSSPVMIVVEAGVVILGAVVESCSSTGVNIASSPVKCKKCERQMKFYIKEGTIGNSNGLRLM